MQVTINSIVGLSSISLALACSGNSQPELSDVPASERVTELSTDGVTPAEASDLSDAELEQARFSLIESAVGRDMAERVLTRLGNEGTEPAYELALSDDHSVSWYEPRPGFVTVVETTNGGDELLEHLQGMTLQEQYSFLAPSPVPRVLTAMQARSDEMRPVYEKLGAMQSEVPEWLWARKPPEPSQAESDSAVLEQPQSSLGTLRSALTSQECVTAPACRGNNDFDHLLKDRTRDTTIAERDVSIGSGRGCSIRGTVNYRLDSRVWSDWTINFRVDLTAGQARTFFIHNTAWDFDFETYLREFRNNAVAAMCAVGDH